MVLIGRLTKDAVVAQLKDERKVVNFTLAVNDYYKSKGSDKGVTVTTYVNCAYWISSAIATLLKKGNLVEIAGRLSVNAYTNMQGEAKGSLTCHVDSIKIHQQMKTDTTKAEVKQEEPVNDLP
ncbi:MAG: single-stranded DNA-binding protein, partial [Bacteroidetes bacterium]|nr:single-stranded DNA-binding protein [Bacteroidota bacterium]